MTKGPLGFQRLTSVGPLVKPQEDVPKVSSIGVKRQPSGNYRITVTIESETRTFEVRPRLMKNFV